MRYEVDLTFTVLMHRVHVYKFAKKCTLFIVDSNLPYTNI